jgi:hypothetical protein
MYSWTLLRSPPHSRTQTHREILVPQNQVLCDLAQPTNNAVSIVVGNGSSASAENVISEAVLVLPLNRSKLLGC